MYAVVNPSELAFYLKEMDHIAFDSRTGFSPKKNIRSARVLNYRLLSFSDDNEEPADSASWLASNILICRSLGSITRSVSLLRFEQIELSRTFRSAPDVIFLYYCRQHDIDIPILRACMQKYPAPSPSSALPSISSGHSFQKTDKKIAQKSTGLGSFILTDEQWAKVRHLFPTSNPASPACGRPAWSSRQVLDAIFWMVAQGVDWDSFPVGFPSSATCRRYMGSWINDGRLLLVYLHLYNDLMTRGDQAVFEGLNNYFYIDLLQRIQIKKDFLPTPPGLATWQLDTTRLFLQFAYQIIQRIRREDKNPRFPS